MLARSSQRVGHDDTGFDRFETSFARVPSKSPAPSDRCGLPPNLLDRFWTINHLASLNPTNWPQRSSPLSTTNGAERLRKCFWRKSAECLVPSAEKGRAGLGTRHSALGTYNRAARG